MPTLTAHGLSLGYDHPEPVVKDLEFAVMPGAITTLIGPNGCGKSTILRSLARLMKPRAGQVLLDGRQLHRLPTKEVAQRLGLLSQHSGAPGGMTVEALVRLARSPHRGAWEPLGASDEAAVSRALDLCGIAGWRHRLVDELSGGQRQRAWIALVVAQETPLILLDEPTTYLDPEHQQEVLDLIRRLHETEGKTFVLVLHDLAQAAVISHRVVALSAGRIIEEGSPAAVLTPGLLSTLYGIEFDLVFDPAAGIPLPRPRSRLHRNQGPWSGSAASVLVAKNVVAGYGKTSIVGPVDLTLSGGGFTAVLGPNGGGKSTLLRTLAGIHPLQAGSVELDGQGLHRLAGRTAGRLRTFLSQDAEAPPGMTVGDLGTLGRFPHRGTWGRRHPADSQAVAQALGALDLESLRDRPVSSLSGGQRQRAWLALALAQESPLLLLDEPTSFLDPGHQIEVLDALWTLTRQGPRTVVAILHDRYLAQQYADRILVLGTQGLDSFEEVHDDRKASSNEGMVSGKRSFAS